MEISNKKVPVLEFCYKSSDPSFEAYLKEQIEQIIMRSGIELNFERVTKDLTLKYSQLDKKEKKIYQKMGRLEEEKIIKQKKKLKEQQVKINLYNYCKYCYQLELLELISHFKNKVRDVRVKGSDGGYAYYGFMETQKSDYQKKFPKLKGGQIISVMAKDFAKLKDKQKQKYHQIYLDKGLVKFRKGNSQIQRINLFSWFRQQHEQLINKHFVDIPQEKGWDIDEFQLPDIEREEHQLFSDILKSQYQDFQQMLLKMKNKLEIRSNKNSKKDTDSNQESKVSTNKEIHADQITFKDLNGFMTPKINKQDLCNSSKKKIFINRTFNYSPNFDQDSQNCFDFEVKKACQEDKNEDQLIHICFKYLLLFKLCITKIT